MNEQDFISCNGLAPQSENDMAKRNLFARLCYFFSFTGIWPLLPFLAPLALVFGFIALKQIKNGGYHEYDRKLAINGITTSLTVLAVLLALVISVWAYYE